MAKQHAQKRRGFTLTELAIVLGVMGTILSAIWVASARVSASNKVQKAAGQILQISSGYRSLYTQHGIDNLNPTIWVDSTCIGVNAGFFPADMLQSGVTCQTGTPSTYPIGPWGSYVQVETNGQYNTINIGYYLIPSSACISLGASVWQSSDMSYQATYNGTWNSNLMPPFTANAPWTTTQINGFCASTATVNFQIGVSAH